MKRLVQFLVVIVAVVVSVVSMSFAAVLVSSGSISMGATITGSKSMVYVLKNVSDNATVASYQLGTLASGGNAFSTKGAQYIQVTVNDSYKWHATIWTNNFPASVPSTAMWGLSYGGLIGTAGSGNKIPMAWKATTTVITAGLATGDPTSAASGWLFLKDYRDVTDPLVDNSSYSDAVNAGYTTFAFGNGSYTNIVAPTADPKVLTLPVSPRTAPFYIYTEVDISAATADTYTGTLVLDIWTD